jgi:hypothetical protein
MKQAYPRWSAMRGGKFISPMFKGSPYIVRRRRLLLGEGKGGGKQHTTPVTFTQFGTGQNKQLNVFVGRGSGRSQFIVRQPAVDIRGKGFVNWFLDMFRSALPLIRKGGVALGRQALASGIDWARDLAQQRGGPPMQSFKRRVQEGADEIKEKWKQKLSRLHEGSGRGRKRKRAALPTTTKRRKFGRGSIKKKKKPKQKQKKKKKKKTKMAAARKRKPRQIGGKRRRRSTTATAIVRKRKRLQQGGRKRKRISRRHRSRSSQSGVGRRRGRLSTKVRLARALRRALNKNNGGASKKRRRKPQQQQLKISDTSRSVSDVFGV